MKSNGKTQGTSFSSKSATINSLSNPASCTSRLAFYLLSVVCVGVVLMGCAHTATPALITAYPEPEEDMSLTPIEGEPGYWRIHITDLEALVDKCQDAERDRDVYRELLEQYHIEYGGR